MTDKDIIKALGCISGKEQYCRSCKYSSQFPMSKCRKQCAKDAIDLINRLKAENERLEKESHYFADIGKMYSEVRTEAIKEFAERLKEYSECYSYVTPRDIDNLVEEMEGDMGV